jgi:hypothetical protein
MVMKVLLLPKQIILGLGSVNWTTTKKQYFFHLPSPSVSVQSSSQRPAIRFYSILYNPTLSKSTDICGKK